MNIITFVILFSTALSGSSSSSNRKGDQQDSEKKFRVNFLSEDVSKSQQALEFDSLKDFKYQNKSEIEVSANIHDYDLFEDGFQVFTVSKNHREALKNLKQKAMTSSGTESFEARDLERTLGEILKANNPQKAKDYELECIPGVVLRNSEQNPATFAHIDFFDLEDPRYIPDKVFDGITISHDFALNVWMPANDEPLKNWNLGFLPRSGFDRDDVQAVRDMSQPLQPVNGSIKKSKLKGNTKMVYDADMQWGKAYVFVSGSKNGFHIPMHAAMDNGEKFKRGSMEFRCIAGKRNNSNN